MTYTILGCHPATRRIGVALATHSIAAGGFCPMVRANLGTVVSQAYADPRLIPIGMRLLELGFSPQKVVAELSETDSFYEYRQVAVMDPDGASAVHSGAKSGDWTGHRIGEGYIAMGNCLDGEHVVDAMAEAFEGAADEQVEERLLQALEAGRDAGGQRTIFYERSAALIVHERETFPDIDLRVDLHDTDALGELRRAFEIYKPSLHWYNHIRTKEPDLAFEYADDWDK